MFSRYPRITVPNQLSVNVHIVDVHAANHASTGFRINYNYASFFVKSQCAQLPLRVRPKRLLQVRCINVGESNRLCSPIHKHCKRVAVFNMDDFTNVSALCERAFGEQQD